MPDQAILIQTADAIAATLNENRALLGQEFTAERSYADWDLRIDKAKGLLVDVVVGGFRNVELETPVTLLLEPLIEIGLRQKIDASQFVDGRILNSALDPLVLLVEGVLKLFAAKHLADFEAAAWTDSRVRATFVPKHLREWNQFTAIITLGHEVATEL